MARYLQVPYFHQRQEYTCGPVVLQVVLAYYGVRVSLRQAIRACKTSQRYGTPRRGLVRAARAFGLRVYQHTDASIKELAEFVVQGVPVIVNYNEPGEGKSHFAVVIGVTDTDVILHDPSPLQGPHFRISHREFVSRWYGFHKHNFRRWLMAVHVDRRVFLEHT